MMWNYPQLERKKAGRECLSLDANGRSDSRIQKHDRNAAVMNCKTIRERRRRWIPRRLRSAFRPRIRSEDYSA